MNDDEIEFRKTGFEYVNPAARVVIVGITPGVFVACGNAVGSVIAELKSEGIISAEVISIPHPSGANAGRIAAFLKGDDASLDTACRVAREQARMAMRVVNSIAEC